MLVSIVVCLVVDSEIVVSGAASASPPDLAPGAQADAAETAGRETPRRQSRSAAAQGPEAPVAFAACNYPGRKAAVVNNCPYVELSGFSFENRVERGEIRPVQHIGWKTVGDQPFVACEIVILKYDPFNRRMVGMPWTVAGTDSEHWSPLPQGRTGEGSAVDPGREQAFTAIAYVRLARLQDGTIWQADEAALLEQLRTAAPEIKDFGDLKPEPPVYPRRQGPMPL